MASYVAQTLVTSASAVASWAIAPPTGVIQGHQEIVIAFGAAGGLASLTLASDGPTATQMVHEPLDANGTVHGRIGIWRKAAAETPGNVTVTPAASSAHVSVRMGFANVDLASPIDAASASYVEGTHAPNQYPTMTIPGITTTRDNCMAVVWFAWRTGAVANVGDGFRFNVTSGWTKRVGHISDFNANSAFLAVATRTIATAGSTGDVVIDPGDNGDASARNWIGGMFALSPATTGGTASARRRITFVM